MTTRSKSEADKVAAAGFAEVYEPVKPYLDDLDVFLQSQVSELEPEIQEHVRYVFGHSGKRLRPMLVAYSGWEGPGAGRKEALIKLGSVIELVHLATLVHDDILDEADTRHRQETAAKKFGPAAAVLIGDVLFSHALKLAAEFETTEVCRLRRSSHRSRLRGRDRSDLPARRGELQPRVLLSRDPAQDRRAL